MSEQLLDSVKSKYGAAAESALPNDDAGVQAVAEAFGSTAEELASNAAAASVKVYAIKPRTADSTTC